MDRTKRFCKRNAFLLVVTMAAIVSCFFVIPNKNYIHYINFKTLASLFCLMLITSAFVNIRLLRVFAAKLLGKIDSTRKLTFLLVFFPAILGMFLSNDITIITFAPFSLLVLNLADKDKLSAKILALQLIATNAIGSFSPLGNSQSLYLFNHFNMTFAQYAKVMAPFAIFSAFIVMLLCLGIKNEPLDKIQSPKIPVNKPKAALYTFFFAIVFLAVFDAISFITAIPIVVIGMAFVDKKAFKQINYPLLFIFFMFFILAGNLRNINIVNKFFDLVLGGNEYILSAFSSQAISNTPTTLIISQFTTNSLPLLLGINVGKCGTLHASMNGIIANKIYGGLHPKGTPFITRYYLYSIPFFIITFLFGLLLLTLYGAAL